MSEAQVLEGTWAEIAPQAERIAALRPGQRLRLIVPAEEALDPSAGANVPRGRLTAQESVDVLDELAQRNRGLPVLPPEAFERESIYEDGNR